MLDNRYLILDKAGEGGMACVYRAEDQKSKEIVAIKVLHAQMATKAFYARFKREFKTCSRLRHPNIIGLRDMGNTAEGGLYYAMEFLPWQDLEDLLVENLQKNTTCSEEFVIKVMRQMADAFAYYHALDVVHRDLKPANVMISDEGKIVITDFGLALDLNSTRLTATGTIVGSPLYMSPELITASNSDFRSDYYQMGVIVYNLLTGKLPFNAPDIPALALTIMHRQPTPVTEHVPAVSPQWDLFLKRCLAKKPDDRFASAEELKEAIEKLKVGKLVPPAPSEAKVRTVSERKRELPKSAIAAGLLFLLFFLFFALSGTKDNNRTFTLKELQCLPDVHSLEIRWQSDEAYASRVYIEGKGLIEGSDDDVQNHRLVIGNLKANSPYIYKIVYPNGERSLPKRARTKDIKLQLVEATRVGKQGTISWHCEHAKHSTLRLSKNRVLKAIAVGRTFTVELKNYKELQSDSTIEITIQGHEHNFELRDLLLAQSKKLSLVLDEFKADKIIDGLLSMLGPGSELVMKTMGTLKQDGSEIRDKQKKVPKAKEVLKARLEGSKAFSRNQRVAALAPLFTKQLSPLRIREKLQNKLTEMVAVFLFSSFEGIVCEKPPLFALPEWSLSPTPLTGEISEFAIYDKRERLKMGLYYPVTNLHGKRTWEKSFQLPPLKDFHQAELAIPTGPSAEICLRISVNGRPDILFYDPRSLPERDSTSWGKTLYQRIPIEYLSQRNKLFLRADPLFRRFTRNQVLVEKITLRLKK